MATTMKYSPQASIRSRSRSTLGCASALVFFALGTADAQQSSMGPTVGGRVIARPSLSESRQVSIEASYPLALDIHRYGGSTWSVTDRYFLQRIGLGAFLPAPWSPGFPPGVALLATIRSPSRILFRDGFSSYAAGSFPAAGGWQQYWGNSPGQIIPQGCSTSQSLRLVGAHCWSAVAYHSVAMPERVRFEVCVYIEAPSQYGCGPDMVHVGFWDPPPTATWGLAHDFVQFAPDGNLYVWGQGGPLLQAYSPQTWHRLAIVADFSLGTFDVEIDGTLYPGFAGSTQVPSGIAFYAGHGTAPDPVAWFDDVRVLAR